MVGIELSIQIHPGKRREFLQAFKILACKTEACTGQFLYENTFEESRFLWVEHWTDKKALKNHLSSEYFRSLLGAIDVLGELENTHLLEFKDISDGLR